MPEKQNAKNKISFDVNLSFASKDFGSIINVGVTQIELKEKITKKSIFGENPLKWSCQETMNGGQICSSLILHKKC